MKRQEHVAEVLMENHGIGFARIHSHVGNDMPDEFAPCALAVEDEGVVDREVAGPKRERIAARRGVRPERALLQSGTDLGALERTRARRSGRDSRCGAGSRATRGGRT